MRPMRREAYGGLQESIQRHLAIVSSSFKDKLTFRFDFCFSLVASIMTAGLLYYLWSAIYRNSTHIVLSMHALLTYVVLGQAFSFTRIAQAQRRMIDRATNSIQQGNIVFDLLRPIDYQVLQFSNSFGMFVAEFVLIDLPAYVFALVVFRIGTPASVSAALGFAVSVIGAFVLAFALDFLLTILAFWTSSVQGIMYAKKAVLDILAGSVIPLSLFPDWLRHAALVLPFRGIAFTPLSIYIGTTSGAAILVSILMQMIWAAVLVLATRLVWLRALRRIVIYGE